MSDKSDPTAAPTESAPQWAELWQSFIESSRQVTDAWLADRPHHPGAAATQWLKELYQENRRVDGSFVLSGRKVDLKAITAPASAA
jgi:hypothetical protein